MKIVQALQAATAPSAGARTAAAIRVPICISALPPQPRPERAAGVLVTSTDPALIVRPWRSDGPLMHVRRVGLRGCDDAGATCDRQSHPPPFSATVGPI